MPREQRSIVLKPEPKLWRKPRKRDKAKQPERRWWFEIDRGRSSQYSSFVLARITNEPRLRPAERVLLWIVAAVVPTPPQTELAACLGLQPRRVRDLLVSLVRRGLIRRRDALATATHTTVAAPRTSCRRRGWARERGAQGDDSGSRLPLSRAPWRRFLLQRPAGEGDGVPRVEVAAKID